MSRKTLVLYIGWLGHGNAGDELLLEAHRKLFPQFVFFHGWRDLCLAKGFLALRRPAAVFLGGGTLISQPVYSGNLRWCRRKVQGIPIFVFGTGVADADLWGSFGWPIDTGDWCDILEDVQYLGVRGPLSAGRLREWGFRGDIEVIGDPVLWFARAHPEKKPGLKRVGLNLGPSRGHVHGRDEGRVLAFGAELIEKLARDGWSVTLFPMVEEDLKFMEEAVALSGREVSATNLEFLDRDRTLDAMESQDVFVGEKLHSVVMASCVYTPSIMLEYRPKCRDFMQSIGREEWTYRTDELDVDLIWRRLGELYENVDAEQQNLFSAVQKIVPALRTAADTVTGLLPADETSKGVSGI
ncbi:polysaccharide pyruvyl transferase family protein [Verrucomicrobiota bacterium]